MRHSVIYFTSIVFVLFLAAVAPAESATFTVNSTADTVDAIPGNGTCADAGGACTLRAAIGEVNAGAGGDTINLPAGTYTNTIAGAGEDLNATGDLDITKSVTITGAGAGATIIDGGAIDRVFDIINTVAVNISGVTIQNGSVNSNGGGIYNNGGTLTLTNSTISGNTAPAGGSGGGIYNNGGTVTLTNSTISGNTAPTGQGGGIFNNSGTTTVTNSTISNNQTTGFGGGIYNSSGGTLTITNSTISGNAASPGAGGGIYNTGTVTITNSTISGNTASGGNGGGIFNNSGTTTVTNSTISNNQTTGFGGGIFNNFGATLTVTNSTISGNSTGFGGGIWNNGGTMTVTNSTISGNSATGDGGGIYNVGGGGGATVTITNSTISNNTASGSVGGGIFNGGTVTVTNSTISGNSATGDGGGIYNSGTATVTNTTISGNTATGPGGGIYNWGTATITNATITDNTAPAGQGGGIYRGAGTVTLENTIVAKSNGTGGQAGGDCSGTMTDHGWNLASDGTCGWTVGTSLSSTNPLLGALANNGGPTQTHAISATSPAFNAGDNTSCNSAPVNGVDQRGVTRPQGATCDIGAYEADYYQLTIVTSGSGAIYTATHDIDCPHGCTAIYAPGTQVTLYAWEAGGSSFGGWGGACSGTGRGAPCVVTMNQANTVTGNFDTASSGGASGSGGVGGSSNNAPDGGDGNWLFYPTNGGAITGTQTSILWKQLTDADNDPITYTPEICDNPDFTGCNDVTVQQYTLAKAIGGIGAGAVGLFAFGFILVGAGRTKKGKALALTLLLVMAPLSGVLLASCGSSGSSSTTPGGETYADCSSVPDGYNCARVTGLTPGATYSWRVTASDGKGGSAQSVTWSFIAGN